jgi:hypothetical protein
MTFAALEEIRRVVLILIKGSRGNDCVFFDHGFILAGGCDIWGLIWTLLSNSWVTKSRGRKVVGLQQLLALLKNAAGAKVHGGGQVHLPNLKKEAALFALRVGVGDLIGHGRK